MKTSYAATIAKNEARREIYVSLGLSTRTVNALLRADLSDINVRTMRDSDLLALNQLGPKCIKEARSVIPYRGEGHSAVVSPPDNRLNSAIWTTDQWERVAAEAERLGYGDKRLSDLPALANDGILPYPVRQMNQS